MTVDPEHVEIVEEVPGSRHPIRLMYVETWDGLYAPIGLRFPSGNGPFPVVLLASGNGGGGMGWIRDAVRTRGYIMERLLESGFACAWIRYRTEVELGYNLGGALVRDMRQGRGMFNRSPLEYEDEIAIVEYLKTRSDVDGERIGLIGSSHGGEMALKITSEYQGIAAAVANEPAAHEFLVLQTDSTVSVNEETGLRNIEEMQMSDVDYVLGRIDTAVALDRIATIDTPILVIGRDDDHLQGIFRSTYVLLEQAGKDVEWVSYDHPVHGFVFPFAGTDGRPEVDSVQEAAIDRIISFLSHRFG
ncbi:MAG TPA: acyl-CoA thioester hydrolase/BAAT C-terminal domain-containing protein [Acidimicrobiia bacterium]|nr:acyl-CoA thioester hydrolase/BAAT C-terminal domain-containing protein [Acidimicrobiia bacterium]